MRSHNKSMYALSLLCLCASLGPAVNVKDPLAGNPTFVCTSLTAIRGQTSRRLRAAALPVPSAMDDPVPMETGGQASEPATAQPDAADAEAPAPSAPAPSAPVVGQDQSQPPAAATPAAVASQPEARKPAAKADGDEAKVGGTRPAIWLCVTTDQACKLVLS